MNRQVISEFNRVRIVTLIEEGHTQVDVAVWVGVNQSDVSRIVKKYRETNSVSDRPKSGRPRIANNVQERFLTLTTRRNPSMTAPAIRRELQQAHIIVICDQTIRNRLYLAKFIYKKTIVCTKAYIRAEKDSTRMGQ
ncbi:uncharacterized protein LOC126891605 [Diabrotica virgifera virgifera]|uniref:Protein GVQW3-like n=1 Tax=Diabrotica virgifera virgifera TaxID=50390 RepID=A0ABM5L2S2_DIAVI|nr:uncharacterized protein LOC126891605 [Diabrotica virgifera virgifera]